VLPYFASIDAAFKSLAPNLRCGVYGSGAVCEAVMAAQLADFPWLSCSLGWSNSRAYFSSNKWVLRQHVPAIVAGIDCDPDDANGDFGDFAPFGPASPASP
jgi:hypothetical protein